MLCTPILILRNCVPRWHDTGLTLWVHKKTCATTDKVGREPVWPIASKFLAIFVVWNKYPSLAVNPNELALVIKPFGRCGSFPSYFIKLCKPSMVIDKHAKRSFVAPPFIDSAHKLYKVMLIAGKTDKQLLFPCMDPCLQLSHLLP